jgi:hypothetical protein
MAGTLEKKVRFGYQWDKVMMCLGMNQNKIAKWNQFCGETNLGLYYTGL